MKQLYVVGIGPGKQEQMTMEACEVLEQCDVIAGYTVYVDLLREQYPHKEYIVTGMRKEMERCRLALETACQGKTVAMVCSGDSGVYGMAGIILELREQYPEVEVQIIPGVTAALSGAALLGAPLGHDFVVISLSDLLTPWETICLRLRCAAEADYAMAIYNPASKKRQDYLQLACEMIMEYQPDDLVCGYVRNIGREGQQIQLMTIKELADQPLDMFTTVFIGNSQTKIINGRMVTPRGYHL